MTRKTLQLLSVLLIVLHAAAAKAGQPSSIDSSANSAAYVATRRWQLELSLSQPLAGELRLHFFRKLSERWDGGVFAGYRLPFYAAINGIFEIVDDPLVNEASQSRSGDYFTNDFASGYLLGLSAKKHLAKKRRAFFQLDLFARYWHIPENSYTAPLSTTTIIENEHAIVYGSKILLGSEWFRINPAKRYNFGLGAYFGAGLRLISATTRYTFIDANKVTEVGESTDYKPRMSLQLGLNLILAKHQ